MDQFLYDMLRKSPEEFKLHVLKNKLEPDLSGAKFAGLDLRHAYLSHANLAKANLQDADLRGATLSGANLCEAFLQRADLRGTYLADAIFWGAYLNGVKFDNSTRWREARLFGARGVSRELYKAYVEDLEFTIDFDPQEPNGLWTRKLQDQR